MLAGCRTTAGGGGVRPAQPVLPRVLPRPQSGQQQQHKHLKVKFTFVFRKCVSRCGEEELKDKVQIEEALPVARRGLNPDTLN